MTGTSQYFVTQANADSSFLEFGFAYGSITLDGESITFNGGASVDTVSILGNFDFDFTNARGGVDVIYLNGAWGDYEKIRDASKLTLSRGEGETAQEISSARGSSGSSDLLVFSDGSISGNAAWVNYENATPTLGSLTSDNPDIPDPLSATLRGFAQGSETGSVFASFRAGISLQAAGSSFVDTVYTHAGGVIDASDLRGGVDLIYLRGNWADYERVRSSSAMTFTRTIDGAEETVIVSRGSSTNFDRLIFADGAISANTAWINYLVTEFSTIPGYIAPVPGDDTTATPGVSQSNEPEVLSFATSASNGSYVTGQTIAITATMSESVQSGSSFEVTLDTGVKVTLTAVSAGTTLSGSYTIGAGEKSGDLTVISFTTGSVQDLDGNAMTSTDLPASADNIAANHDIAVNSLTLTVNGVVTELDVRGNIVLGGSLGENLAITTQPGTYEIKIVNLANDATGTKTGFHGETVDGSQTITVTVDGDGNASSTGGALTISEGGMVVINPEHDLDLSNNYEIQVPENLFVKDGTSLGNDVVGAGDITFSTVTASVSGEAAQNWLDDGTLVTGATWYDGSGGDYFLNDDAFDFSLDLSSVSGIVVLGRDADHTDKIVLDVGTRAHASGFGANDHFYIDRDVNSAVNVIDENSVSFSNVNGSVPTILGLSSLETGAAALVTFANNGNAEDTRVASAFAEALVGASGDFSFEGLTGNANPVISG